MKQLLTIFILFFSFGANASRPLNLKKIISCKGNVASFESIDVFKLSEKKLLVIVNGPGFLTARFKLPSSALKINSQRIAINSNAPWMQLVHDKKNNENLVAFKYQSQATATNSFGQSVDFANTNYKCL